MASAIKDIEIEALIDKEYEQAVKRFGNNHSRHESYAVLKEEIEEAKEELGNIEGMLESIWANTKSNAVESNVADQFHFIKQKALKLAIESIQVAAVARKGQMFERGEFRDTRRNIRNV